MGRDIYRQKAPYFYNVNKFLPILLIMIIHGTKKFISAAFDSEKELENIVQINAEYIFGPDSIYLPKSLIRSPEGFGTIPDGFVVDLSARQ